MSQIVLKNIDKFYGSNHVLKNLNLTVNDGEFMTLLGPSGCGKTTTLRVIAGLEKPQNGTIEMDGHLVVNAKELYFEDPGKRGMNLVFQSYALWPHMTVFQNVAFVLNVQKVPKEETKRRVMDALERMRIEQYADRYPSELSGGQQQRVAIARAIVSQPKVLLLDEPLSNLDARLRLQTREEIRRIQKETGITTVFVTHDQEEAMSISDMIVVMKLGVVQQIGKPQEVYDDPANLFVANFLGTPPINVFSGRVEGGRLFIGGDCVLTVGGLEDQEVTVGIRPEGFILDENGPLTCRLNNVEVMGRDVSVVSTHAASLKPSVRSIIDADDRSGLNGETVRYSVKPHKLFVFHKETEQRLAFEVK